MATLEQIDQAVDAIAQLGVPYEMIARRAEARGTDAVKEYFRAELRDPDTEEYVVQLIVNDWSRLQAFLDKPATDQFNLQPIYRVLLGDIAEAIATHSAEKFGISLLLGVKALKP